MWNAHPGDERLVGTLEQHYLFPIHINIKKTVEDIRKSCLTCQACKASSTNMKAPLRMTVVPPRVMASVAIDIFHLPEIEWQNQLYDTFVLCVDRHSGWMIARPTQDRGLTGEKVAHLLIDTAWGEMGVPSIITSDQGPQFVSQWWQTMCARLGIRQAYSQAYHHQANGRAEVAGRILKDTLRALLVDKNISWVEALPRALRIIHDTPDPVTGLSPYEIMFGRPRNMATLPWDPQQKCEEAEDFLTKMAEIDKEIAQRLNSHHEKQQASQNKKRPQDPHIYKPNDMAWILRPNETVGVKLDTRWHGPYRVLTRVGEFSYQVKMADNSIFDVHVSHMKPCHWEVLQGPHVTLRIPPTPTSTHDSSSDSSE